MFMRSVVCVNWGNLPNRTYEMGPVTVICGPSASGKTTLIDAIQTVMTGARRGLYHYNPGQEESTQGGRGGRAPRTLASYILGADQSLFARTGCYGYAAINFVPSPCEEGTKPFCALLGAKAYVDAATVGKRRQQRAAKEDDTVLILVNGAQISEDDLILERVPQGIRPVPTDRIVHRLRERFGHDAVRAFADHKANYLQCLYGMLRGRSTVGSEEEALRAARAFSRFMAYKPLDNIDDFIKEQILEPEDLSTQVADIARIMREVRDWDIEAARLRANVETLEEIDQQAALAQARFRTILERQYAIPTREIFDADQHINIYQASLDRLKTEEEFRRSDQANNGIKLDRLASERDDLQRRVSGLPVMQQKQHLEEQISVEQRIAGDALQNFLAAMKPVRANHQAACYLAAMPADLRTHEALAGGFGAVESAARALVGMDLDMLGEASDALTRSAVAARPSVELCQQVAEGVAGIDEVQARFVAAITDPDRGLRAAVEGLFATRDQDLKKLREELKDLDGKIQGLKEQQVTYPRDVQLAIEEIRATIPGCTPHVLCDLVEVRDPDWQAAIEGYLGNARFQILVEPVFEARAISAVKRAGLKGARVTQGEKAKADASRMSLPPESIVHLLRTEHPIARAYLHAAYGPVVRVENVEHLRRVGRGVTCEGHGAANYTMFYCLLPDAQLTFGHSGRERQRRALLMQMTDLEGNIQALEGWLAHVKKLRAHLNNVQPAEVVRPAQALLACARRLMDLDGQISRLDLRDAEELDQALTSVKDQIKALGEANREHDTRLGSIQTERTTLNGQIEAQENNKAKALKDQAAALEQLRCLNEHAAFDLAETVERIAKEMRSPLSTVQSLKEQIGTDDGVVRTAIGKLNARIPVYNQNAREHEAIHYDLNRAVPPGRFDPSPLLWVWFLEILNVAGQIRTQLKRQRDSRLGEVADEINKAKANLHSAFTTDFCQMILSAVNRGTAQLDRLNLLLREHRFSEEIYQFIWEPVEQFRRYRQFFEAVRNIEGLGEGQDMFSDNILPPDMAAVRDELVELLLGTDQAAAVEELKLIADYRSYHRYDVERDIGHGEAMRLSEFGTGSGAQLQTPGYVIRAATLHAAFRLGEPGAHLRTVVMDETFAAMDEARSREVLQMLGDSLGFQVIFVIPSKSAGPFTPLVTNHYVVTKTPTRTPIGELHTITQVKYDVLKRDAVAKLFEGWLQQVQEQTLLKFAEDEAADG